MRNLLRRFATSRSATSAVEFALVLPVLLILLFGGFEVSRYYRYARHLAAAADTFAALTSQRATVSGSDAIKDAQTIEYTFPEAGAGFWGVMNLTITHVVFTPSVAGCTTGCTYVANVAWAFPSYSGRQCGTLAGSASDAGYSLGTIPQALIGPGSVIVVTLGYWYQPLI